MLGIRAQSVVMTANYGKTEVKYGSREEVPIVEWYGSTFDVVNFVGS